MTWYGEAADLTHDYEIWANVPPQLFGTLSFCV